MPEDQEAAKEPEEQAPKDKILIPGQVIPRRNVFYSALFAVDDYDEYEGSCGYRDLNIEVTIKHALGTIRFVCEKEYLTEKEKKANEGSEEPIYRRGDKHYRVTGVIKEGGITEEATEEEKTEEEKAPTSLDTALELASDIAKLFFDLGRAYKEDPNTESAFLIVKTIPDMVEYSKDNPLYSVGKVSFASIFQAVEFYWHEEKEKLKEEAPAEQSLT